MINTLPSPKTNSKHKRVGRGMGSGKGGHTTGRGGKGATARTGHKDPGPAFEGGQNPISRRLPRLKGIATKGHGFTTGGFKRARMLNVPVQLSELEAKAKKAKVNKIDFEALITLKLVDPKVSKDVNAKILFDKKISSPLTISGIKLSKTAKEAVTEAGGSVE